jgi:DNA mismatch repair protein MutL
MIEVYGPAVVGSLIELEPVEESGARLHGVISGPELTRPGRGQVNLIVNRRWVQPRGLLAAVEGAYRPLLPRGRHPLLTLSIDVPSGEVDINIHPAKLEVRLRNERPIGAALGRMIRDALGSRPIEWREPLSFGRAALDPLHELGESPSSWDEDRLIVTPYLPPLRLIGQVQRRLLMLEGTDGMYLVDQHRAHERIIFERLAAHHAHLATEHQALPEPLLIELRPAQVARFARRLDEFAGLGFQFEEFGGRAFLLRAAPLLPGVLQAIDGTATRESAVLGEPDDLIPALLSLVDDDDDSAEAWRERLMVSLACRTAVRRGRELDRPLMLALVDALGHTSSPAVCPHGSPLLLHLSGSLIERQFDWR